MDRLVSLVDLHLAIISDLVFGCLGIPAGSLVLWKLLEPLGDHLGNLSEGGVRVFLLDDRPDSHREQEVGAEVSLGLIRVLLGLLATTLATLIRWRDIVLHLCLVPLLVGGSLLLPMLLLRVRKGLVFL